MNFCKFLFKQARTLLYERGITLNKKLIFAGSALLIVLPLQAQAESQVALTPTEPATPQTTAPTSSSPNTTVTPTQENENTIEPGTSPQTNDTEIQKEIDSQQEQKKLEAEKKVDALKEDLKKSEGKKTAVKQQISEINKYIDETEKTIMDIQNKINDTQSKITSTENNISSLTKSLGETQEDIVIKTAELNEQKKKLGETISFMYQNRDFGFFQFFFQTENLQDLINAHEFINIIADENEKIYKAIKKQEKALKTQQKKLEDNKKKVEEEKNALLTLKKQQEIQKAQQDAILNTHKEHETEMANKLVEEENHSKQIMAEIKKVLEEVKPNTGTENIPLNPNQVLTSPMKAGTYTISSVFGYRVHPVLGRTLAHNGIDMAAPLGTPIYSAGTGTVLFSGPASGFGNWIVIQHDNGLFSIYGHMSSETLYVKQGQRVQQGQLISAVGNQGRSTGPHLHLSIANAYNGSSFSYIDPLTVLK
jgi:murein DD-endopeptidase MepM/ murein hydrolase activator NlpD